MLGFFGEEDDASAEDDVQEDPKSCTTLVEDYRLENAGNYMRLVSSGMTKDWEPEEHPHAAREKIGDFEIFYGVQNDPDYKKFKNSPDEDGMSGLGDGWEVMYPDEWSGWVKYIDDYGNPRYTNKYTKRDVSAADLRRMMLDSLKPINPGLGSHHGFNRKKRQKKLSGLGMFANLSCSDDCDCLCNKKSMSGLGALQPGNLGPNYGSWPPGPRPEPYRWTSSDGTTYTLVLVDGKWMYQSSKDSRVFITTSNLYAMMGVKTDPMTMIVTGDIPGEPHPDSHQHEINQGWSTLQIAGIGAGWVILGGIGAYMAYDWYKKRGR